MVVRHPSTHKHREKGGQKEEQGFKLFSSEQSATRGGGVRGDVPYQTTEAHAPTKQKKGTRTDKKGPNTFFLIYTILKGKCTISLTLTSLTTPQNTHPTSTEQPPHPTRRSGGFLRSESRARTLRPSLFYLSPA